MVIPNITSKYVWAYETTPGIAELVAVDSVSYEFGKYDELCKKWNSPFVENEVLERWKYNSRTPTLTKAEKKFPIFKHIFNPTTAQWLSWILKNPVIGPPVSISTLNEKLTYPLTIRLEELGGDNPNLVQGVGCYCIKTKCRGVSGNPLLVECDFAWQKMEDLSVTERPILTKDPFPAGSGDTSTIKNSYDGRPQVVWDVGGENIAFNECVISEFDIEQEYKITSGALGTTQTIHTYKYKKIPITLHAILETNLQWDDYVNRNIKDLSIKFYKPDMVNYTLIILENCHVITTTKTANRNEGHFECLLGLSAEKITAATSNFANESEEDFGNHWKGAVV